MLSRGPMTEFQIIHDSKLYTLESLPASIKSQLVGQLSSATTSNDQNPTKPPITSVVTIADLFHSAAAFITPKTLSYYLTGASDSYTLAENENALNRIWFNPRVLEPVYEVDLSVTIQGGRSDLPIYITAFAGAWLDNNTAGELPLAETARDNQVMMMIPCLTQLKLDDLVFGSKSKPDQHTSVQQWYQLYIRGSFDEALQQVNLLEGYPNITTVVFTIDTAQIGHRVAHVRATSGNFVPVDQTQSSLSWDQIVSIKGRTTLRCVLKGIQTPEDAIKAAELGFHGIIISNHGGRQLDFAKSSIEVLSDVTNALRAKNLDIEVYVDGGFRNGSDVIKALALGARAVGLGRPFLLALQMYGHEGIQRVLDILKWEMECTLRLLGVDSVSKLGRGVVDISELKRRGT